MKNRKIKTVFVHLFIFLIFPILFIIGSDFSRLNRFGIGFWEKFFYLLTGWLSAFLIGIEEKTFLFKFLSIFLRLAVLYIFILVSFKKPTTKWPYIVHLIFAASFGIAGFLLLKSIWL